MASIHQPDYQTPESVERLGPCEDWTGKTVAGYGYLMIDGKMWYAHRWVFFQAHGYLPPVVRHRCDRPICVRLDHLEPGTQADNLRDILERGRGNRAKGLENGRAKLSDEQVREIRARYPGEKMSTLAAEFGVAEGYVSRLIAGLARNKTGPVQRRSAVERRRRARAEQSALAEAGPDALELGGGKDTAGK